MEKCLLLGNGGREAVIAENIAKTYSLYSVLPYENPSIVEYVEKSNGKYIIGSPFDKELVKKFIEEENIEVCVISSDNLLQDGKKFAYRLNDGYVESRNRTQIVNIALSYHLMHLLLMLSLVY